MTSSHPHPSQAGGQSHSRGRGGHHQGGEEARLHPYHIHGRSRLALCRRCPSLALENRVLYNLDAIVGHSANRRTMPTSDQEDGAPCRGEHEAEGSYEADGEKHPEGPARMRSCRIKCEGPRVPKGGFIRVVGDHV